MGRRRHNNNNNFKGLGPEQFACELCGISAVLPARSQRPRGVSRLLMVVP